MSPIKSYWQNTHKGVFPHLEEIVVENYDGSLNIDVFDLYRDDSKLKEIKFLVVEQGNIRIEGDMLECLSHINKWL